MNLTLVFIYFLFLSCSYHKTPVVDEPVLPELLVSRSYQNCYNAAGFFRVDKAKLDSRIPKGFVSRDGGLILGPEHGGHGFLVLIYFSCPPSQDSAFQTIIIATPIEEPSVGLDLREVRWNWYEFGRIAGSSKAEALIPLGFSVEAASLSNDAFHEGDTAAFFEARAGNDLLLRIDAKLTDSVNFEAQSHRLWHQRTSGQLISTRLDFQYHHSWIGELEDCFFDVSLLHSFNLSDFACAKTGVTEAIETINFSEHVVQWR